MAAPEVPTGYTRYITNPNYAVNAQGSLFNGQVVENGELVDLPDSMFSLAGYPVVTDGYITGYLTNAINGIYVINEYFPSNDQYISRNFTVINVPATGYKVASVVYKYYPINNGGNIVMNDANSFNTVQEVINYLNTAPGNPFTSYAQIARLNFSNV